MKNAKAPFGTCKFCGATGSDVAVQTYGPVKQVTCMACGARGPAQVFETRAVRSWLKVMK